MSRVRRPFDPTNLSSYPSPGTSSTTKPPSTNSSTTSTLLRIKRKADGIPLEAFVVETTKKHQVDQLFKNLSVSDPSSVDIKDSSDIKEGNSITLGTDGTVQHSIRQEKLQERKLFRLAYTITDAKKIKEFSRGVQEIQSGKSRSKLVQTARHSTKNVPDTKDSPEVKEDYVIDIYCIDTKVKENQLDQFEHVHLESFQEDLVYENEYDTNSDVDSEDSNAKEYDYPSEEESADGFSDDSSDTDRLRFARHKSAFDDSDEDHYEDDHPTYYTKYPFDAEYDQASDSDT